MPPLFHATNEAVVSSGKGKWITFRNGDGVMKEEVKREGDLCGGRGLFITLRNKSLYLQNLKRNKKKYFYYNAKKITV